MIMLPEKLHEKSATIRFLSSALKFWGKSGKDFNLSPRFHCPKILYICMTHRQTGLSCWSRRHVFWWDDFWISFCWRINYQLDPRARAFDISCIGTTKNMLNLIIRWRWLSLLEHLSNILGPQAALWLFFSRRKGNLSWWTCLIWRLKYPFLTPGKSETICNAEISIPRSPPAAFANLQVAQICNNHLHNNYDPQYISFLHLTCPLITWSITELHAYSIPVILAQYVMS